MTEIPESLYRCCVCKQSKTAEHYYRSNTPKNLRYRDGCYAKCISCARASALASYRRNPDDDSARERKRKHNQLTWSMRTYGISNDDVASIITRQGGACALCHRELKRHHIDHDHETGRIRGILCIGCNTALGALGDNVSGLIRALKYLCGDAAEDLSNDTAEASDEMVRDGTE